MMADIIEYRQWYVAELVQEIKVEGELNIVDINIVLVEANSPEEAYERAIELGQRGETVYQNTEGKLVTLIFRGLRDLNAIVGGLTHGAELALEKKIGLTRVQIERMILSKEGLGVFRVSYPTNRPNYMSGDGGITKRGATRKRKDVSYWEGVAYRYEQMPPAKPGKATQIRTIQENPNIERKQKCNRDLANFNYKSGDIIDLNDTKTQ